MSYYYQVIPFGQIQESLTYKFSKIIPVGSIVQIPLRRKTQGGVVLSQTTERQIKFDLKKILPIKSFYPHPLSKETIMRRYAPLRAACPLRVYVGSSSVGQY